MDKPKLIMLVGIPGSGKTSWAEKFAQEKNGVKILSSDKIRDSMFGVDEEAHSGEKNAQVFRELNRQARENLQNGISVVYDATNLNKNKRCAYLRSIRDIECEKVCVLFATDYEECKKRNTKTPKEIIRKMYTTFQPPHSTEGWDAISTVFDFGDKDYDTYELIHKMDNFDQQNPHHKYSLLEHQRLAGEYIYERSRNSLLHFAAMFHDIGKLKTKKVDENGVAHYFQHHCVGSYDSLLYMENFLPMKEGSVIHDAEVLEVSNFIYYHMHPFMSWAESEKARKRDMELLGEKRFNEILLLHEADVFASGTRKVGEEK